MLQYWQQANAQQKRFMVYGLVLILALFGILGVYRPLKMARSQRAELERLERRIARLQQRLQALQKETAQRARLPKPPKKAAPARAQEVPEDKVAYLLTSRWPQLQVQWLQFRDGGNGKKTKRQFHLQVQGDYRLLRRYLTYLEEQAGIRFANVNIQTATDTENPGQNPARMTMLLTVEPGSL